MKQLTKEQALQRLGSNGNLVNVIRKKDYQSDTYKQNSDSNGRAGKFSQEERDKIIKLSDSIGLVATAEISGCMVEDISRWKSGITSHSGAAHNTVSGRLKQETVEKRKESIQSDAVDKVLKTIGMIDDNKLSACNAVELAQIAGKLSIVANGGKDGASGGRAAIQVNIHVPQIKDESQFETIEVGAIA